MPQILSHEELNVLSILNEAYPDKLHLHELAPRMEIGSNSAQLLRTVDGLLVRGLIEGKPLRGSEGLADAANLRITGAGTAALEQSSVEKVAGVVPTSLKPIQASILNVLMRPPRTLVRRETPSRAPYTSGMQVTTRKRESCSILCDGRRTHIPQPEIGRKPS